MNNPEASKGQVKNTKTRRLGSELQEVRNSLSSSVTSETLDLIIFSFYSEIYFLDGLDNVLFTFNV